MIYYSSMNESEITTNIDLSNIIDAAHENKWVAISPDYSRVIDASASLRDLMKAMADKDVILHRVLPHDVSFAPLA